MNNSLLILVKKLVSILPSDWNKVTFSTFVRECSVNGKKAYSKEFKCYCLSDSCIEPINIVKVYEENFEVEDLFFDLLDFFYNNYFRDDNKENFIILKINSDGVYGINQMFLENDISNDEIVDIITQYIEKNA